MTMDVQMYSVFILQCQKTQNNCQTI